MRWILVAAMVVGTAVGCAPARRLHTTRFPGGGPRWEVEMVRNQPHGQSRRYHENGRLAERGTYVEGQKHGKFEYWDEEGNPIGHKYYDRGALSATPVEVAEPPPPEPARDPLPAFATLDRTDAHTRLGAAVSFSRLGERLPLKHMSRVGGHGQVVRGRWGAYGTFSVVSFETRAGPTADVVDAPELGGFALVPLGRGLLVPRVGAIIPVDETESTILAQVYGLSGFDRITDFALTVPNAAGIRPAASYIDAWRFVRIRADAGVDVLVDVSTNTDRLRMDDDVEVFGRANAGVDLRYRSVSFLFELANTARLTESTGERVLHAASLGVRGRLGVFQLWAGGAFPLDDSIRGDFYTLMFGVDYAQR